MYYTIYKITNKLDGKFYIGSHKTKKLDDDYMGSGKYLRHAQHKYGMSNFEKNILHVFHTPEEMYAKEAEIVNEDFLATENTYNLKRGGYGGFDHLNSDHYDNPTHSTEHSRKMTERRLEIYAKEVRATWSSKAGITSRDQQKGIHAPGVRGSFEGRSHTDETKLCMSKKAKERLKDPTKNSQYGTMWITNGESNRKIPRTDNIPQDWYPGRLVV